MPTVLEVIKAYEWDCPEHPGEGSTYGQKHVNALFGAGAAGCKECLVRLVGMITEKLGVKFPQKRDPGPNIGLTSDRSRAGVIYDKCRELGHTIGDIIPPGCGFCLLLFEFHGRQMEYICNADRPSMIGVLEEFREVLSKKEGS